MNTVEAAERITKMITHIEEGNMEHGSFTNHIHVCTADYRALVTALAVLELENSKHHK